ncbi:MAG: acylphosphatase, partial [Chloroflexota bacterium]
MAERIAVSVRGTVQGVGFRPFVYRLAERHRLSGWVLNHSGGVDMEIEGAPEGLEALLADLRAEAPPLARIDALNVHSLLPTGSFGFEIRASSSR